MATSTINRNIKLNQVEMRQIKESKAHAVVKTNTKTLSARSVLKELEKMISIVSLHELITDGLTKEEFNKSIVKDFRCPKNLDVESFLMKNLLTVVQEILQELIL